MTRLGFSAIGLLAATIALSLGAVSAAADSEVWDVMPYRIVVLVAAPDSPNLTDQTVAHICRTLDARARNVVAAPWNLSVVRVPDPWRAASLDSWRALGLDELTQRLPAAAPPEKAPPSETAAADEKAADVKPAVESTASAQPEAPAPPDKFIVLRLADCDSSIEVEAGEYDVATARWGTSLATRVAQPVRLADAAFTTVLRTFAPLARVETVEKDDIGLRLRGGALPPRDPEVQFVTEGDVFRPVLRLNDRRGRARSVRPVDWTLLAVASQDGAQLATRLCTGLRTPLTARGRGRIEQLAVLVRPPEQPTEMVVVSRAEPPRPLGGYEVFSHSPDSRETVSLGLTDGRGRIMIPPDGRRARVLLVKHGQAVLARVPIVPGETKEVTASIPDDDARLGVEGFVVGLQERFVDVVVERQVLAARVREAIAEDKLDDAQKLLDELRALDRRQRFVIDLVSERQRVAAADPLMQKRLERLFDDTKKAVERFADPHQADRLAAEISDARGTSGD